MPAKLRNMRHSTPTASYWFALVPMALVVTIIVAAVYMSPISYRPAGKFTYPTSSSDVRFCGNGIAEIGEQCDAQDVVGLVCEDFGYSFGQLKCAADCTFDFTSCTMVQ